MIVINDRSECKIDCDTYIALGSFDGLHLGHMSLISKANGLSKQHNAKSMVYTFENHPLTVIDDKKVPKLLMDNCTKVEIAKEKGIDIICMAKFDQAMMLLSPEEFILYIQKKYRMKGVIVGFNYRFGYRNQGDTELLSKLGDKYGFEVYIMNAIEVEGEVVSSTRIRNLILEGDVEFANKMLICPFSLKGRVVHGKKLGRTLGFPTANMEFNDNFICPKVGVYYTNVSAEGHDYKAITNVGYNPTVDTSGLTIETYILDFSQDIYGKELVVSFIKRMRDEVKFGSLEELKEQLEKDKLYAETQKIELQ